MAKLTSRHTVTDHFVEEGTQGLHYCRLEPRSDDPPPAGSDLAATLEELHSKTKELARRVIEPVTVRGCVGGGNSPRCVLQSTSKPLVDRVGRSLGRVVLMQ